MADSVDISAPHAHADINNEGLVNIALIFGWQKGAYREVPHFYDHKFTMLNALPQN